MTTDVDLVLRGGLVVDGTGRAGEHADVAIDGDRVVAIGAGLDVRGRREIDATGLVVAPGFIDPHTHSDVVPLMSEPQPFKLLQGVTTEIVGNCGNSAAPLIDDAAVDIHRPISSTEKAGVVSHPRTFAGYLDEIEAAGPTNHVASLVGHTTLRMNANGGRMALDSDALALMERLADEAFADGAYGLSSGLIYPPGAYGTPDEIGALARVAARWGRPYTTHMRDEGNRFDDALAEALEVARVSGVRVQISHVKAAGVRNHGRAAEYLAILRDARVEGIDVYGDQYPYRTGETFLASLFPPPVQEGGPDAMVARLRDADERARFLAIAETGRDGATGVGSWTQTTPAGIFISMHTDDAVRGRTIAEVAAERGISDWDALAELVVADPASMMVYELMGEDDVRTFLADPLIAIGSDNSIPVGFAHQRAWGCFPVVLGAYVRDLGVLSIEEAVRKMTSMTARQFGLTGRGILTPGAIADVAVIDPATVGHPGSPLEPFARPTGVPYVVLAGHVVVDGGTFTGGRHGRVLRAGHPEPVETR